MHLRLLTLGLFLVACSESSPVEPQPGRDASRPRVDASVEDGATREELREDASLRGALTASAAEVCAGECVTLRAPEAEGASYRWSHDPSASGATQQVCPQTDTRYQVTVITPERASGEFTIPSSETEQDVTVRIGGTCEPQTTAAQERCRARVTARDGFIASGNYGRAVSKLAMLPNGGMRVAADFRGTIEVEGTSIRSEEESTGILIDLDAQCRVVSSRIYGASGAAVSIYGLAVLGEESWIVGTVRGRVDFGGGPLDTGNDYASFVAKLDAQGKALWMHLYSIGQTYTDARIDAAGNLYVVGFDLQTPSKLERLFPIGSGIHGMAKFAADGSVLWAHDIWPGGPEPTTRAYNDFHLDVHADGRFAFAGCSGSFTEQPTCSIDLHDPDGALQWRSTIDVEDGALSTVAFGADGRVAMNLLIRPRSVEPRVTGNTRYDVMFDAAGRELWRDRSTVGTPFEGEATNTVAIDRWNNVLSATAFGTLSGLDQRPLQTTTESNFLRKLDANGKPRWTFQLGDPGNATLLGLATNAAGEIGLAATFATVTTTSDTLVIAKLAP